MIRAINRGEKHHASMQTHLDLSKSDFASLALWDLIFKDILDTNSNECPEKSAEFQIVVEMQWFMA